MITVRSPIISLSPDNPQVESGYRSSLKRSFFNKIRPHYGHPAESITYRKADVIFSCSRPTASCVEVDLPFAPQADVIIVG